MRLLLALLILSVGACHDDRPQAPTADESARLDQGANLLDSFANEEGPEAKAPDPSNRSD